MTTSVFGPQSLHASATSTASSPSTSSTSAGTSTITASDFVTLLVTEMKNQDPTQPTAPSQYIQQLVGVNSLQQLIGINSGIGQLDASLKPTTPTTPVIPTA